MSSICEWFCARNLKWDKPPRDMRTLPKMLPVHLTLYSEAGAVPHKPPIGDIICRIPQGPDAMVFSRPPSVPYPNVWRRFTVQRGSSTVHLRVQDLTEDLFEPSIQLLLQHFTRDEPPCKYIGIHKYPSAVAELEKLWRTTVKDNLSLVCVEDKENACEVVGVNVLTVVCKRDKEEPFHTEDKIWAKLFGAVDLVARSVDVFTHFGVDKYLTAYGLVVPPEWRGLRVGQQLLEARIPFCKSLGVKVTVTVFTAAASQAVAKKAGFVDLFEISYEELGKRGFLFPGVEQDTKSSKLMALVVE